MDTFPTIDVTTPVLQTEHLEAHITTDCKLVIWASNQLCSKSEIRSTMMPAKVALIFGASGVSGWSFVNELLNDYPQKGIWGEVYALTNRPLSAETSFWPSDPRLKIVSGIDLLKGSQNELENVLKSNLPNVDKVTHVYYLAYKANIDMQQELKDAVEMFKRSTIAVDRLSSALEFLILQTGAKMYGCHLLENHPSDYMPVPLKESYPRLKAPHHDMLFYHPQLDWLMEYCKDKQWNWCDTRPDIIVGFVPNQNFYSLGTVLGIYLSLYREIEGEGADCPFPGTSSSWVAKSNDSSSDMIARQTLHLSLTLPVERRGEGFNVADARIPQSWSTKWPQLCQYFGLKGTGPLKSGDLEVRKYIQDHLGTWKNMEKKYGLRGGIADSDLTYKGFEYFLLTQFDFDRQYDMSKMYGTTGFDEERTTMQAWGGVFDRMKAAKLIP